MTNNPTYQLHDKVRVKALKDIPVELRNTNDTSNPDALFPAKSKMCGKVGEIVDVLTSAYYDKVIYRIHFDDHDTECPFDFGDALLVGVGEHVEYSIRTEVADGKVTVILCKICGDIAGEVERAFGFIKGNEDVDVANALSYASRLLFTKMGGRFPSECLLKARMSIRPTRERR